jgi:hypothetical protein
LLCHLENITATEQDGDRTASHEDISGFRKTAWAEAPEKTKDAWRWLVLKIMPVVIGRKIWNKRAMTRRSFSEVATVSDEAFALLVLENYRGKWISQLQRAADDTIEKQPTKYTAVGKEWNEAGIRRFTALYHSVKASRERDVETTKEWDKNAQMDAVPDDDNNSVHTTAASTARSEALLAIPMDDLATI